MTVLIEDKPRQPPFGWRMFSVRLAGGHLYGKQLFTWLSRVVSFVASFVLSFFPLDVLDGIWDLIESVSEGFLTYSSNIGAVQHVRRSKSSCSMSRFLKKNR